MTSCGNQSISYSKPASLYNELATYNKNSLFGPPLPPLTPSMQYPTLPREPPGYQYNALTHGYNGTGYYTIDSGYGGENNTCTTFFIGKCPSNREIPLPSPPSPNAPIVEGFSPSPSPSDSLTIRWKYLDVEVLVSKSCPYSKRALELLEQHKLLPHTHIKDISLPVHKQEFDKLQVKGVPVFVSKRTHRHFVGHPSSIIAVIGILEHEGTTEHFPSTSPLLEKLKQLKIVFYGLDNCIFCEKLKKLIIENHATSVIQYKDANSKDSMTDLLKYRPAGYPFLVSHTTGKTITGVPESLQHLYDLLTY